MCKVKDELEREKEFANLELEACEPKVEMDDDSSEAKDYRDPWQESSQPW